MSEQERKLAQEKREAEESWTAGEGAEEQPSIGEEEIADIVSMWTGIPVFKLTEAETQKLLRMEDELHKRVIGQEAAITATSAGPGSEGCTSRQNCDFAGSTCRRWI